MSGERQTFIKARKQGDSEGELGRNLRASVPSAVLPQVEALCDRSAFARKGFLLSLPANLLSCPPSLLSTDIKYLLLADYVPDASLQGTLRM